MAKQVPRCIVEAGACWCPGEKAWRPCVRFEGDDDGSLVGPYLKSERAASQWAMAYATLKNAILKELES